MINKTKKKVQKKKKRKAQQEKVIIEHSEKGAIRHVFEASDAEKFSIEITRAQHYLFWLAVIKRIERFITIVFILSTVEHIDIDTVTELLKVLYCIPSILGKIQSPYSL